MERYCNLNMLTYQICCIDNMQCGILTKMKQRDACITVGNGWDVWLMVSEGIF